MHEHSLPISLSVNSYLKVASAQTTSGRKLEGNAKRPRLFPLLFHPIWCRNRCERIISDMLTSSSDSSSLFKRRHLDSSIIILCVRWYITYKLSSRDLRDMMAERGINLSHTTILRRANTMFLNSRKSGAASPVQLASLRE